ncbi:hypothetical protein HYPSUDRAFT_218923 [Hypholoma sublateritium FD-334 SS-4]|uniref:Nephrocystin 3-like N-terminal domain-containing protein n=1 Tax=Hypholoma sublateritium (strain FD-334 SS-4) TaxID=945553 RepID=A0A0D2KRW5_HYPSF|nr:hypothetical protein HYPSUDRAFT_218923 [Hypholoma sublateritium FD-334 SS-4]
MNWVCCDPAELIASILWLHGPPGSGKSSFARTIAMRCEDSGIFVASFFLHTDPAGTNAGYLVATLVNQFTRHFPGLSTFISRAIEGDPFIFGRSLEVQFRRLIFEPMSLLREDNLISRDFSLSLVVIDGLDQCDNNTVQSNIIHDIANILQNCPMSILFLITSCAHPHLTVAFSTRNISKMTVRLPIDDMYLPHDRIRVMLNDGMSNLKSTHSKKDELAPSWPPADLVHQLVKRASGHVLYVSTMIKHLSHSLEHPAKHLDILLESHTVHNYHPFSELDALYSHILSTSSDVQRALFLLHHKIYGGFSSVHDFESLMYMEVGSVQHILSELKAVVTCDNDTITLHHSSFADFLLDPSRCGPLHMDPGDIHARFARMWFEQIRNFGYDRPPVRYRVKCLLHHLKHANATAEIHADIVKFRANVAFELSSPKVVTVTQMSDFLGAIRHMDFEDSHELYIAHLRMMHPIVQVYFPEYYTSFSRLHLITYV